MWFYSLIFILLVVINGLGYFYDRSKLTYVISLFSLAIIAAFRPSTCCADYFTYTEYYNGIDNYPLTFLEPTYFVISFIAKLLFNDSIGVFIIYAMLGVGLKGVAMVKLSKYYPISLVLYFGSFFLLHEMTQIRVGVASAFMLLAIPYIQEKNSLKFFALILAGCMFHYSLVVALPFYFLNPNTINKKLYIGVVFGVFAATLVGVNIITVIQHVNLGFLSEKMAAYQIMLEQGLFGDISLINPLLFLRIFILIFFILNANSLVLKNCYSTIIIKIYTFSILAFISLSPLPAVAGRISQLLGVVEIILVPYGIYLLKPKYAAAILFVIFALLIMYKQLYYSDLMQGYFN
jgi:hypothetical protein